MDEAAKLSDRLQVLQAGRVRAEGVPASVLGDVVGEHVLLLNDAAGDIEPALQWCRERGVRPSRVLDHYHLALDAAGLSAFIAGFPDLRYEVRPPTLDDLFLALSTESEDA